MLAILPVILPVFVIVAGGYAAARVKLLPDSATDVLMLFVIRFTTPALLFTAMYDLDLAQAFEVRLLVSYYASAFICFGVAFALARTLGKRPGESVAIAFGAYFSNTLLIGLPIMLSAYGEAAAEPMYGIFAMHSPILYSFGMIAMEAARRDGTGAWPAAKRAARNIASNALMLGIAAGLLLNLVSLRLPTPVSDAIEMLGDATLPTALFALGAALTRYSALGALGWSATISAVTLVLMPALAWMFTAVIFQLDDAFVRAAVVPAAMPAGLNVYVFAAMYRRAEPIAAGAVLLSTALSIVTISFWLSVLGGAG